MRLVEIIGIVKENFVLASAAIVILAMIFFLTYFVVYKKIFNGKKTISKKKLLLIGMLISYVIMVIGVTFLNRGPNYFNGIDLSLFSSYREAWNSFSVRLWQFVYLNIMMFVPLGMLLPLIHPRLQKARWTIGIAALCTFSIETVQLLTGFGNFVVDDLFNNLLGAIIGYGLMMGFFSIKNKTFKRLIVYFSPLLLVILLSGGMYTYYQLKEFGNLSITPSNTIDMSQATMVSNVSLGDNRVTVPIYKAPSYQKADADNFVQHFFEQLDVNKAEIDDISYPDLGYYRVHGEKSYSLSFYFLDGSYNFLDFSSSDDNIEPRQADEKKLKENLEKLGITIPSNAQFQQIDIGTYEWTVNKHISGNQLTNGSLTVFYYNDNTVKEINNQLITYEKVRDVEIKSEREVYEEILKGKFQFYVENSKIESLHVNQIEVSYYLDSKGYYQPVYSINITVDGINTDIFVPGI